MEWTKKIRFVVIFIGLGVVFVPFLIVILDFDESAVKKTTQSWHCNNSCEISFSNSSAISTYKSFSLDISSALFVHFTADNVSLQPSNDILDPLNLIWVKSIDAPFLSFDLGFNVYSLGLLSRKVHHMTVKLEEDARRCMWNMNYTCVTETLSTAYLRHVSKGSGVLCHAIEPFVLLKYQCCRENRTSRQIECGIPALISSDMAAIFEIVVIVAAIAFLWFPYLWDNFPDENSSKTLSCNTRHICINPAFQTLRHAMKAIRRCIPSNWADFVKNILIGLFIPILYYIYLFERWYTMKYEIPKMFNYSVKKTWYVDSLYFWLFKVGTPTWVYSVWFTVVAYHIGVVFYSVHKLRQEFKEDNDFRINWMIPVEYTLNFVRNTYCEVGCLAKWILGFLKILISPFVFGVCLIGYAFYISPTVRVIDFLMQIPSYYEGRYVRAWKSFGRCVGSVFILIIFYLSLLSFGTILSVSLLLILKHIVYILVGLVANNDYLSLFSVFTFIFGYYVWDCFNYESRKYEKLFQKTFEKCKEQQEGQAEPTRDPPLKFDKKGVPIISTKLFQHVIDEILPLSEVYTKLFLKITIILSFLLVTYFTIMVFGKSSLNNYTRALAVFLGGIIPKLVELFRDNSSELLDIQNSYKIEKIVNDFINSNENSGNGIQRDYLPELSLNDDHAIEMTTLNSNETDESFVTAPSHQPRSHHTCVQYVSAV